MWFLFLYLAASIERAFLQFGQVMIAALLLLTKVLLLCIDSHTLAYRCLDLFSRIFYLSVINDSRVFFQYLFCPAVELIGYFMNLIFSTTIGAAHTHSAAHPVNF
jgi:hypothetical protein